MNISIEEKKTEAVLRMQAWGIYPETVKQFRNDNKVSISIPPWYGYFWLDEDQEKRVKEFEKKYSALVYVAILSHTNIGDMESYLYVSDHKKEWKMDREDILNRESLAYVYNLSYPDCSEIGTIGVYRTPAASLARKW